MINCQIDKPAKLERNTPIVGYRGFVARRRGRWDIFSSALLRWLCSFYRRPFPRMRSSFRLALSLQAGRQWPQALSYWATRTRLPQQPARARQWVGYLRQVRLLGLPVRSVILAPREIQGATPAMVPFLREGQATTSSSSSVRSQSTVVLFVWLLARQRAP
jgi:hypothetical protein